MRGLFSDVRSAFRQLRRSPGFTAAAVACLGLGIGANTAIFSLIDATLLRAPAGVRAQGLVTVAGKKISVPGLPGGGFVRPLSVGAYRAYREHGSEVFAGLAAVESTPLDLSLSEGTLRIRGQLVSDNYFDVLEVEGVKGRGFDSREERSAIPSAVISDSLRLRLGWKPGGSLGQKLVLDGRPFTIVGEAPPGFHGTVFEEPAEVWLPLGMAGTLPGPIPSDALSNPTRGWLFWLVGKLRPELSFEEAAARLEILGGRMGELAATADGTAPALEIFPGIGFRPGQRPRVQSLLLILMGLVSASLLMACANLATLMLARANARRDEIGVRLALGSTRGGLARRFLAESVALVLLGSAVGLCASWLAATFLQGVRLGQYLPPLPPLTPSLRVLAFTAGTAALCALALGVAPALRAARLDPATLMQGRVQGTTPAQARLNQTLIVAQVAGSLAILIGAGLLARSLRNLDAIDPGFRGDSVLSVRIDLELQGYDETRGRAVYQRLLSDVSVLPGVDAVSLAFAVPLGAGGSAGRVAPVSLAESAGDGEPSWVPFNAVGPDYFRVVGIPLTGRDFSPADGPDSPPVTVVNRTLAETLWPGTDPVGLRLEVAGSVREVVGVCGDVRQRRLDEQPSPYFYVPILQSFEPSATLHVRSGGPPPLSLAGAVRQKIRELDDRLPVLETGTLAGQIDEALAQPRLFALLVGVFGLLTGLLSLIGLYGSVAYAVSTQGKEIAIRVALGADQSDIVWRFAGRGLLLTAAGSVLGIALALVLSRTLESFLYGVGAADWRVYGVLASGFAAVALTASYIPARRAARVDPVAALKGETP